MFGLNSAKCDENRKHNTEMTSQSYLYLAATGTVHDNSYCTLSAVQVQHVFSDYGAILPDLLVLLPAVSRWSISCLLVLPACYLRVEVCSCFLLLL